MPLPDGVTGKLPAVMVMACLVHAITYGHQPRSKYLIVSAHIANRRGKQLGRKDAQRRAEQPIMAPALARWFRVLPRSGYLAGGGTAGLTPPLPEGDAAPGGVKDARDR